MPIADAAAAATAAAATATAAASSARSSSSNAALDVKYSQTSLKKPSFRAAKVVPEDR